MARNTGPKKTFEHNKIVEVGNFPSEKGDGGIWLGVASWIVDGKEMRPGIEKREYWNTEYGEKSGKLKALTAQDFIRIIEKRAEVFPALGVLPADFESALAQTGEESKSWNEWNGQKNPEPAPARKEGEPF